MRYILIGIFLSASICLLQSCSQKTDFASDGPFIIATHASAGPNDYRNMFSSIYAIDLDGNLTLSTEPTEFFILGEDAPVFEMKLAEEKIEHIQELLEDHNFWNMPTDVDDMTVLDGESRYVTVYLTDKSKKVGGLNPSHEGFLAISDYIFNLVDDNDYRMWHDKTTNHIFELNP